MRWLPLTEAARALGVSTRALEARRERGTWDVRESVHGRRRIFLYAVPEDDMATVDDRPPLPPERPLRASSNRADRDNPKVAIICSDVHIPEHDEVAWTLFLAFVRDVQPDDLVLAGDILELESCSQHGGVAQPALFVDEVRAGRREMRRVRGAAPDARIVYLEGNHETRLSRKTVARIPELVGAIDIPTQLGLDELGIEWLREGVPMELGRLSVVHGWYTNKHHAAKHTEAAGRSVLYGHTHRPQFHIAGTATGVRGGFGNGCLRTLQPDWMNGRPSGWMHGFSVVHYWPDGEFQVTPVLLTPSRRFAYGGRVYG